MIAHTFESRIIPYSTTAYLDVGEISHALANLPSERDDVSRSYRLAIATGAAQHHRLDYLRRGGERSLVRRGATADAHGPQAGLACTVDAAGHGAAASGRGGRRGGQEELARRGDARCAAVAPVQVSALAQVIPMLRIQQIFFLL